MAVVLVAVVVTLLTLSAAGASVTALAVAPAQEEPCQPAYSPCLPIVDDLNCSDLSEAQKPVTILVVGVDPYQLDNDWTTATSRDGIGCEEPIPITTTSSTTTAPPSTTTAAPTTTAATTTTPTTTAATQAQSGQPLARTGANIILLTLVGFVLLEAGYVLASSGRVTRNQRSDR